MGIWWKIRRLGALWKRPETLQGQDECSPHVTPELGSSRAWDLLGVRVQTQGGLLLVI